MVTGVGCDAFKEGVTPARDSTRDDTIRREVGRGKEETTAVTKEKDKGREEEGIHQEEWRTVAPDEGQARPENKKANK